MIDFSNVDCGRSRLHGLTAAAEEVLFFYSLIFVCVEETTRSPCQLSVEGEKKNKAIFFLSDHSDVKMFFWQASVHSCIICFIFLVFHKESETIFFLFQVLTEMNLLLVLN